MRRKNYSLPDSPYSVEITNVNRPLKPPSFGADLDQWQNRNQSSTIPFQLQANVSVRALPRNLRRSGLLIQNLDASTDLRYSLGNDMQGSGLKVGAGGSALFDFTTPPDELYLFSTANIVVIVLEMTRTIEPPKMRRLPNRK